MTWFKVDDGFNTNPKTAMLSDAATALWIRAGSWSCSQLTDGFIPRDMLPFFRKTEETAIELVEAGLWEESEKGWNFHDWSDYQPTRAEVLELREKRREAGRRGGRRSAAARWEVDSEASKDKQTPKQVLKQKDKQVLKQTPKQKSKQVLKQNGSKTEAKFNPVPVPVPNKRNSPYRESKESAARFDAPPASTVVGDDAHESVIDAGTTETALARSTLEEGIENSGMAAPSDPGLQSTTGKPSPTSSPNPSPAPAPDEIEVVQGELVPTDGVPAEPTPTAGGDRRALLPGEKDRGPRPKNVDDWRPLERQVAKCSRGAEVPQLRVVPGQTVQEFRSRFRQLAHSHRGGAS